MTRIVQQDEYESTTVNFMHGEETLMTVSDCFVWPNQEEFVVINRSIWFVRAVIMDYTDDNETTVTCFVIPETQRAQEQLMRSKKHR